MDNLNLLPKSNKEFGEKEYWNKFFKRRGKNSFEWYGEYLELCNFLHKYIKKGEEILVTGCGNSKLSADLYDVGFVNITNIDISEIAIRQMNAANVMRKKMKYLHMDAMNMSFDNESFNTVIDKGTLDALMSDDSKETNQKVDKYLSEINRVLRLAGRFICISLLQMHILDKLLDFFCNKSWLLRVIRCHEAEEKNDSNGVTLPVFMVVAVKFREMPGLILEVCMSGDKYLKLKSPKEVKEYVKSVQDVAFISNGLKKTSLDDHEMSLDLLIPGEESARYTLYVIDHVGRPCDNKYAMFIVPQGRETEWLFATPLGRRQLQTTISYDRLVIVILRRGHRFDSLQAVKDELASSSIMLKPKDFNSQIPFLSLAPDVGKRIKVYEGTSKYSGDFVVEDIEKEGSTLRRLTFLDNQFLVQSEAKLVNGKSDKTGIDFGFISHYHAFMCVGVQLCGVPSPKVAVLGLGGGSLCMFLKKCFKKMQLTAVELDPSMLELAQNHFGLTTGENFVVRIEDGLDFLKDEAKKGNHYDVIVFDMDNKDRSLGLSCPPREFLEETVLKNVVTLLENNGHLIINLVCRDKALRTTIIELIKKHFAHIAIVTLHEDVNEVVFATNSEKYTKDKMEEAVKELNSLARHNKLVSVKCVDLQDFMQALTVHKSSH